MQTRPAVPGWDEDFVFEVYCSCRSHEVASFGLFGDQALDFLRMQHRLQRASYLHTYPSATWHIVELAERRAGYQCVANEASSIRLVDLALLPAFRGQGLGTSLLRALQAQAVQRKVSVCLSVRPDNRARGLYERLGFHCLTVHELSVGMAWSQSLTKA